MIQLHTDCLVFETSDGESIPCSAQDVTVELLGDAALELEPHMVNEAAEAGGGSAGKWATALGLALRPIAMASAGKVAA